MTQQPDLLKPYLEKIKQTERPCIEMTLTPSEQISLWQSHVGGQPYLPSDVTYPTDSEQQPLALLAQINFAEVPANSLFPTEGILQFFIGTDDLYGLDFDDQQRQNDFRVIFHPHVTQDIAQLQQTFPETTGEEKYSPLSGQYSIDFGLKTQAISIEDAAFGEKILDGKSLFHSDQEEDSDEIFWNQYVENFPASGHHLAGYPFFTQSDPREYNASIKDYILLLQIDSDQIDGHEIIWGDTGVGNFFIHPEDLKNRDFSKVVYNWDCY